MFMFHQIWRYEAVGWMCVVTCFLFMIVGLCVVDAQSSYDAEEERSGQTDISTCVNFCSKLLVQAVSAASYTDN